MPSNLNYDPELLEQARLLGKFKYKAGICSNHAKRLKILLQRLDAAIRAEDMNTSGMDFHGLKGNMQEFYSVSVNGNW